MTSEKKSLLLGQLQEAIDLAVAESGRIGEIVEEMRRWGFDLTLMIESTVTLSPINAQAPDAKAEARGSAKDEIDLTSEDLEFLRGLKVAA